MLLPTGDFCRNLTQQRFQNSETHCCACNSREAESPRIANANKKMQPSCRRTAHTLESQSRQPPDLSRSPTAGDVTISYWMLLLWLFFVWSLWAIAATLQVRLTDIRDPLPDGQLRFMSILPVIPLHPLFFWGVAFWIDGIPGTIVPPTLLTKVPPVITFTENRVGGGKFLP